MQVEELRQYSRGEQTHGRRADRPFNPPRYRDMSETQRFTKYTPLNTGRTRILEEALSTDLIKEPRRGVSPQDADRSKYCRYHRCHGHITGECATLKDKIEELIQVGHLQRYVARRRQYEWRQERSPMVIQAIDTQQDDPMVITIDLANCEVRKTLVDQGSYVDVLYWRTFRKMGLEESEIIPLDEQIVGFSGERVDTKGYVDLDTRFWKPGRGQKTISVRYIVVDVNISYNALLGRPSLNKLGAIVSTPHLAMKFPSDRGTVATVYANQKTARECYVASLKLKTTETTAKRNVAQRMVAMTDLDPRINDDVRMKPSNDVTE